MFPGVAMVSDALTDGWYLCTRKLVGPMHIVCPNCSTSYAIEKASLGAAGRTSVVPAAKTTGSRAHTSRCRKWQPPRTRTHSQASFGLTNERKQ
jgi:predicted Zn finger-like uncharacterized protein